MLLAHWGLREKPFENIANGKFFFASNEHAEALSRLTYAVTERKALALLSGDYGSGKTTVCAALADSLPPSEYQLIHVVNPLFSAVELFGEMARPLLETVSLPEGKSELLRALREALIRNISIGRHNVVILDETHLVDNIALFDELRMLLNYQHKGQPLLTMIFVGQSDLRDKIGRLPALRQRIAVQAHVKPMREDELPAYVAYRLRAAGCARAEAVFEPAVFPPLHAHSAGVPRIINNVCDLSLLAGWQAGVQSIGMAILRDVLSEVPNYEEARAPF